MTNRAVRTAHPGRIVLGVAMALAAIAATVPARAGERDPATIEIPVRFDVINVNRSKVPCPTDGGQHHVDGYLVGPAAALLEPAPAATVFVPGAVATERAAWRQKAGGGEYDVARGMAEHGHISITLDRLSFGTSSAPNGFLNCLGGEADVLAQVVDHLRAGTYEVEQRDPVAFGRVALASESYGGLLVSIAAYSFQNIDALVLIASAMDQGLPVKVLTGTGEAAVTECSRGGLPKREGGPRGYTTMVPLFDEFFGDIEPEVKADFIARAEREACGQVDSLVPALVANRLFLRTIEVPTLFVAADEDWAFPLDAMHRQQRLYSGSDDSTLVVIENAGHTVTIERGIVDGRTASARLRSALSDWLAPRGF